MQHFIATLLVTLCPTLHGSKQGKMCQTIRGTSSQIFHGVKMAPTSAGHGMALGTMTRRPAW